MLYFCKDFKPAIMERIIKYKFEYPDGTVVSSGGNCGYCIVDKIDHEKTVLGQTVNIVQFNISGSFPSKAKIVGILRYDWDIRKPLGWNNRATNIQKLGLYEKF